MAVSLTYGSVSPRSIESGDSLTISWRWSGSANTSSYFDIYADSILINSVHPNSSSSGGSQSVSGTWSRTGTWTFSVEYRENGDSISCGDVTVSEPDPVVMGTCSISPTQVSVGDPVRITWNYSGTASTSSWFDIYASQSPSFSSATLVASVRPPATYRVATWSNPGTWYFWVVYRENGSRTSNYATLKVLQNIWKPVQPHIYVGGWRPATAWIYTNGAWRRATMHIFKE